MLVNFTQFLLDNKDKENFIDLATKELMKYLPEDERTEDYARCILRLLKREEIHLTNDVTVNLLLHVVCKNEEKVELTPTEVKIMELLASNVDDVVTFDEMILKIWGFADKDIVKVNISNLRRKLGLDIISVPTLGYTVRKETNTMTPLN